MKADELPQRVGRLVRVSDALPGISRLKRGSGFVYRDARGRKLTDAAELGRIRALAIPPAYTDVWICEHPNGHLQATGLDARGRKQYRYHRRWREQRDARKFDRLLEFGSALPRIRARVALDLASVDGPGLVREQVLATIVRLLDTTLARVGNDEYARENHSFGLTTLRSRHVDVRGSRLRLRFRGKSGVLHDVVVQDRRVARTVRRCLDLPGSELFRYVDEAGAAHSIASTDVNDYLREAAAIEGASIELSAKDFRTWHASVTAFDLARKELCGTVSRGRMKRVLGEVAARLGNTIAVCRSSYVHPSVLGLLTDAAVLEEPVAFRRRARLRRVECGFLAFLENACRR